MHIYSFYRQLTYYNENMTNIASLFVKGSHKVQEISMNGPLIKLSLSTLK